MNKFLLFLTFYYCFGIYEIYGCDYSLKRQQVYLGPEVYHVHRNKEGGTKQSGTIVGIRVGYDRLKRYGWYIGGDAFYASGNLKGRSTAGHKLHSKFIDRSYEGRLGYTFQYKCGFQPSFTPYVGVGNFIEKNNLSSSCPLPIHSRIEYNYLAAGFLSWMHWRCFELGLNFKLRYPYEPKCYVTHDPDYHSVKQRIKEELQYRVELPLTYRLCCSGKWAVSLVPFYEYRNYGSHPNYPFDFIETKFNIWGATLELLERF